MKAQDTVVSGCETYLFDSFEVSVRQRMLRRGGERLKLQELPFQMLLILLETPGELVSKDELGKRLWGQATFIEVDKSLYVMAGKLREALGDDAAQPRFIKTVSGRGYRFIGDVTPVLALPLEPPPTISPVIPAATSRSRLVLWATIAAMVTVAIVASIYRYDHRALASDQDRIVVGTFTNSTGNPDLDRTLSSAVQLKLQESPYLSLIPDQKFRAALHDPDSASLQSELTACSSLNGQELLKGRIAAKAQGYEILLTAWRCSTGQMLTVQKADATSQATILPALDLATERMRRRLGEPENSLQKFNVPLVQATTASLAALRAFTLGEEMRAKGDTTASIASYKLAIDLDTQFALAYARLGTIYNNIGQYATSRQYYQRAFDLRYRASDREKLYIVTHFYEYATGETKRAIEDYELWHTLYPRDIVPINNLAIDYLMMGQPKRAVGLAQRAIQLDPTNDIPYGTLTEAYLKLGEYSNVQKQCNDVVRGKMNVMGFHRLCFQAAFALKDEAGMQKQLQWAHGNPQESEMLDDAAWVAMVRGNVAAAHHLFTEASQNAVRNDSIESEEEAQLDQANLDADLGFRMNAQKEAQQVLKLQVESAPEQAYTARALARSGDVALAGIVAKKAASMAPLDTTVNSAMLASVRAAIAMQNNDPKQAIDALEEARSLDLSSYMELAPAYYRGLAYLQDHQPQKAVAEFQSVIDNKYLADFPVYVTLSQLELGHAYQLLGKETESARAFASVADEWKDADPGFPPLRTLHAYQAEH